MSPMAARPIPRACCARAARSSRPARALLDQLAERADLEAAHLAELRVALTPPDLTDELEARALATFQERYRRRGAEPLPEDPRSVEGGE